MNEIMAEKMESAWLIHFTEKAGSEFETILFIVSNKTTAKSQQHPVGDASCLARFHCVLKVSAQYIQCCSFYTTCLKSQTRLNKRDCETVCSIKIMSLNPSGYRIIWAGYQFPPAIIL